MEAPQAANPVWETWSPTDTNIFDMDSFLGLSILREDEDDDGNSELRTSRFLNNGKIMVSIAVLTQVIVLAVISIVMGVAVMTMCAFLGELLVIAAVAAALERQLVSAVDLATFMEVSVTVIITVVTIILAALSGGGKLDESNVVFARFT